MTKIKLFLAITGTLCAGSAYAAQAPEEPLKKYVLEKTNTPQVNPLTWTPSRTFADIIKSNPQALQKAMAVSIDMNEHGLCLFDVVGAMDNGTKTPATDFCTKKITDMAETIYKLQQAEQDLKKCIARTKILKTNSDSCSTGLLEAVTIIHNEYLTSARSLEYQFGIQSYCL